MVCGGGSSADVEGNTSVTISGSATVKTVYGGGTDSDVSVTASVMVEGTPTIENIYGGGHYASKESTTTKSSVSIEGGTIEGNIYGGATGNASVTDEVKINIAGGTINGQVQRGYHAAEAEVSLTVGGSPQIGKDGSTGILMTQSTTTRGFKEVQLENLGDDASIRLVFMNFSDVEENPVVATGANEGDIDHFTSVNSTGTPTWAELFSSVAGIRFGTPPAENDEPTLTIHSVEPVSYTGSNVFELTDSSQIQCSLVLPDGSGLKLGEDYTVEMIFDNEEIGEYGVDDITFTMKPISENVPEEVSISPEITTVEIEAATLEEISVPTLHYGQAFGSISDKVEGIWNGQTIQGTSQWNKIDDIYDYIYNGTLGDDLSDYRAGMEEIPTYIFFSFEPADENVNTLEGAYNGSAFLGTILPSEPKLADGATLTASGIEYGQSLAESQLTFTGTMLNSYYDEDVIQGTWSWKDSTMVPGDSGTYTAVFTPNDTEHYTTLEVEVQVEVSGVPEPPPSTPPANPNYKITIEDTENGAVTAPTSAKQGTEATLTPIPDEGFDVGTVTVTDRFGDAVEVTENPDGTYTFTMPNGQVKVAVTFVEDTPEPLPFTDVAEGDWFHDAVQYAYDNGLMDGVGDGQFTPNATTTRAQLVTILYRLAGEPAVSGDMAFTDVESGLWYTDAVIWAAEKGIVNGISETEFAPSGDLTREQLATILFRYAESMGYDVSAQADLSGFPDAGDIQSYATEALSWAVAEGLLQGFEDNSLQPGGTATRAQIATILMRFCEGVAE